MSHVSAPVTVECCWGVPVVGAATGMVVATAALCSGNMDAGSCRRLWYGLGLRTQLMLCEVVHTDQIHHLAVVLAQGGAFGFRDDAGRNSLLDLPGQIEGCHLSRLDPFNTNALLDRLHRLLAE